MYTQPQEQEKEIDYLRNQIKFMQKVIDDLNYIVYHQGERISMLSHSLELLRETIKNKV